MCVCVCVYECTHEHHVGFHARYEVEGIKEFLSKYGITAKSACAAAQFACDCVEGVCEGLLEACREHASWRLPKYDEAVLQGVGARAAGELLQAHAANPYLGRTCDIVEGFKYVERVGTREQRRAWRCA